MDVKTHYDMLIRENNDPFRDPPAPNSISLTKRLM